MLSLTIQPNTLGCLRTTYDLYPSHPDGCTQDIHAPLENIHPRIVTRISPSLDILHPCLYAYWRHTKTESERERMNNYLYSFFSLRNHLYICILCVHIEKRRPMKSSWGSWSVHSPGWQWSQNWQVIDTFNFTHITGPEATRKDALLSLSLPRQVHLQGVYTNNTWVEGHDTQCGLEFEDLFSAIPMLFFTLIPLSTISDHDIDDLSSRHCKTCPTCLQINIPL